MNSSTKLKNRNAFIVCAFISINLITCFNQIDAQKQVKTYYNASWLLTTKDFADYYRVGIIDSINYKYYGIVKDYYRNGVLQMIGNYQGNIKNDEFLFYYPSGNLMTRGYYINNIRRGIWTDYYENGNIKDKMFFNNIFISVFEYYDENGNPRILKGTGNWETQYFDDIDLRLITIFGSFKDSLRTGTWKCYSFNTLNALKPDDTIPDIEVYKKGRFISGEHYRGNGKKVDMIFPTIRVLPESGKFQNIENWKTTIYASIEEYPFLKFLPKVDSTFFPVNILASYPGGSDSLKSEIVRKINLSKSYIKSQKHCFCFFQVSINEKGDLNIEQDPNKHLNELYPENEIFYRQVLMAISNLPKWKPAIRNNEYVSCYYNLSIILENGKIRVLVTNLNQLTPNQNIMLTS